MNKKSSIKIKDFYKVFFYILFNFIINKSIIVALYKLFIYIKLN